MYKNLPSSYITCNTSEFELEECGGCGGYALYDRHAKIYYLYAAKLYQNLISHSRHILSHFSLYLIFVISKEWLHVTTVTPPHPPLLDPRLKIVPIYDLNN